jgi:archaeal type IV pilus assembly protein PilA
MKANQAFRSEEEAVSPVIGVILMVAITVVLAAVVFVLVQNLSQGGESKPDLGFIQNKSQKTLTITSAATADWNDIEATVSGGAACQADLSSGTASVIATTGKFVAAATTVNANDVITMSGGAAGETCSISLRHVPTNQAYGTWDFPF